MPALAAGLSLGEYIRSLGRRLAALTAVLLVAIWALTRAGLLLAGVGVAGAGRCRCCERGRGLGVAAPRRRGAPGGVRCGR